MPETTKKPPRRHNRTGMPRREEFLDAALRKFSAQGYTASSTRDICAEVGIAHSAIYNYFPTKSDILLALEERELQPMVADAEQLLAQHLDSNLLDRLEALLTYTMIVAMQRRDAWMLFQEMLRHLNKRDLKIFIDHRNRYEAIVRTCLDQAIEGGIFPEQDSRLAIFYFFGIVDGVVRGYRPSGRIKPDELARHAVQFFLASVASGGRPPATAVKDSRRLRKSPARS